MARRLRSFTRVLPFGFAALLLLSLSACSLYGGPQSVQNPHGDQMRTIWNLFVPIFWMSVVVFVLVQGLLIVAVVRFRRRPNGPAARPIHGNTKLEITWTILPAVVLAFIAVPTLTTIAKFAQAPGPEAITVRVVGHQWWWEFQYPEYGFTSADEAHIPVGVPINWELESADVIHSFWVPNLAGKTDVVPGQHNKMSYTAEQAGTYLGQCAEFCGIQHANMRFTVKAESKSDFCTWVVNQAKPAIDPNTGQPIVPPGESATPSATGSAPAATQSGYCAGTPVQTVALAGTPQPSGAQSNAIQANPNADLQQRAIKGQQVFQSAGCAGCHAINGVAIAGEIGPNLTHFGSRTGIAGDVLTNTPDNLATWLHDPQAVKEGTIMPNLHLSDEQISDLVAYLGGLK